MSEQGITNQPLTARTAAAQPHHAGIRPAFVDEHQLCWVKHTLPSHPTSALASDLRALLLRSVQSFFKADVASTEEPPNRTTAAGGWVAAKVKRSERSDPFHVAGIRFAEESRFESTI
jgi:hypothetical protein